MAITSFIEHLPYNIYGKGVNGIAKVVQTSTFLNGHITEKQVFGLLFGLTYILPCFVFRLEKSLALK